MARKNNSELLFSVLPFIMQIEKSDSELSIVKNRGLNNIVSLRRTEN